MKTQSSKIRFVVLGCGHIGKRHAEMIFRNKESELVALIDIDEVSRNNVQEYSVPIFKSFEDFLVARIEADVVNVATPNGCHAEHGMDVLDAGFHLVIEKPMTLKKEEAVKLIAKADEKNKRIFCVMQNRYSPPSVWLKNLVNSNVLGDIYMVQINCYWNRDARYYCSDSWHGTKNLDGGSLYTQFSHFIDLMYWCFGDITNIKGKFRNFNHQNLIEFEDTGLLTFDFVNGGIGSFNYSTSVYDKNLESSIMIMAENGTLKIGGQYMNKVEYCHIKNYEMPNLEETALYNDYGSYKGSAANHHFLIQNVIDVLKGKEEVTATGFEGMKVVSIINKIYQLRNG